jgi:MoaA/NifB/PqqE/SkfB family radical SAM enzyme
MFETIEQQLQGAFLSKFKIVQWALNKQMPTTLEVHPTYRCNYNCNFCIDKSLREAPENPGGYHINKDNKSQLTKENMDTIIQGLKDLNIKGLILSGGGEPTINLHTLYLVQEAAKIGVSVGLFTNGSVLTDESLREYIRCVDFIRFSLDDFTEATYVKTKGTVAAMYHKVLETLKKAVQFKKELKSKCKVGVDYIIQPDNHDKIQHVYKEASKLGADYVQYCDCVVWGYQFTERMKREMFKEINRVIGYKEDKELQTEIVYEPAPITNDTPCGQCKMVDYIFQVGGDGGVRPCPHIARHDELLYGNINDKSLKEIWVGRHDMKNTPMVYEYCRFREQNKILKALSHIEHEKLL